MNTLIHFLILFTAISAIPVVMMVVLGVSGSTYWERYKAVGAISVVAVSVTAVAAWVVRCIFEALGGLMP